MIDMEDLVKLRNTGKSIVITIPRNILKSLGWNVGDYIKLKTADHEIIISKANIS